MGISLRRVLTVPAIVLLLLPSLVSAQAQYRCRFSGHVMAAPCCRVEAVDGNGRCAAQVRETECCERLEPAKQPAATAVGDAANQVPPAAFVAMVGVHPLLAPRARPLHDTWRSGPVLHVLGPPLFIVHCALLN
jgi:hypothetical protein